MGKTENDAVRQILGESEILLAEKSRIILAIDGRCGAGKTTLAAELARARDCNVIPMDHFFLRPEQRTEKRLREPGGNIDYERFEEEVLIPLYTGESFAYRPFDCRRQMLTEEIRISAKEINVVEGSYACHPALRKYYDLTVFLTVDPEEQMRRIRCRNGAEGAEIFRKKWIPLEEKYFSACQVREQCDFCF